MRSGRIAEIEEWARISEAEERLIILDDPDSNDDYYDILSVAELRELVNCWMSVYGT